MKFLKALLAIFTFLAVALTGALLFVQDKSAPRYIQIYTNEQKPTTHTAKDPERQLPSPGFFIFDFRSYSSTSNVQMSK